MYFEGASVTVMLDGPMAHCQVQRRAAVEFRYLRNEPVMPANTYSNIGRLAMYYFLIPAVQESTYLFQSSDSAARLSEQRLWLRRPTDG